MNDMPCAKQVTSLLCSFVVPHNDGRQPPKRRALLGVYTDLPMSETPNVPVRVLCPMSESLSGKREGLQDNATRKKKGSLLLTRVRAPAALPMQWYGVREP